MPLLAGYPRGAAVHGWASHPWHPATSADASNENCVVTMGRIQTSTGLISGIPVQDTIDKLLSLAARPRDLLASRVADLKAQKLGIAELTALVIAVEFSMQRLGKPDLFTNTLVKTTDDKLLAASITGKPGVGSFVYTPVRLAQTHQLLSQGFVSKTTPIGAGELTIQFGGGVDKGMSLDDVHGGLGVQRGKIKITDRGGTSGVIDLRFAVTIDDVLQAINENGDIDVTAVADGDRLKLIDTSGQTTSNLKVQEVGATTTAADLGLGGIDVSATEATGQDILQLYDGMALQRLNDGNGANLRKGVADLRVNLRDGTSLNVDFFGLKEAAGTSTGTTNAKNGVNAQIKITSTGIGATFDDYKLVFEDDPTITAGNEKVKFDAGKVIKVKIDAGNTRAAEVIAKLNANATFSASFTAANGTGGNGVGVVDVADTLTTSGGAAEYYNETTIGDLIATMNRANPAKLLARISASGDGLELVDLTSGSNTFSVTSLFGGSVAEDLGFTSPAIGGVISGERRLAGLRTVLLDSLAGGYGLGSLGLVSLTNRNGLTTSVDFSSAKTLDGVITLINGANAGITARVNDAHSGILLTDTTGGSSNLVIANGDATNTATKLRIAANVAKSTVNSGSLGLQTFNENMTLASLRNGRGISKGSFLITDSNGATSAVNLTVLNAINVGDVINGINSLGIGVQARINDTGDGLLLVNTAGGSGQLTVTDVGTGTAAKDLRIAGTSVVKTINGTPTKVIDGSYTDRITLDTDDSLQDLVNKINALEADFSASLFNSGSGSAPYRLSLNSKISGRVGELLVDGSGLGIGFQQTSAAQDALLLSGSADAPIVGALISSATNDFNEVIDGVRLSITGASDKPQTVTIEKTADTIISQIKLFVDQYNKLRDKVKELASFNPEDKTVGVLFSSNEILQIDLEFGSIVSSRYFVPGSVQSFESVGVGVDAQGKLQFDEKKFRDKYDSDAAGVERFFTTASNGAAAKLVAAAERLAGKENSILVNRSIGLQLTIDSHQRQISKINITLTNQREQMVKEFARLETVIGNMQTNLSWLSRIQPMQFIGRTRR